MPRYKITGTINKPGGTPIEWVHFSKTKLTRAECERKLSTPKVIGVCTDERVTISNFKCELIEL
nr:DUF1187 family protein [Plesiomonas sp. PI-19]